MSGHLAGLESQFISRGHDIYSFGRGLPGLYSVLMISVLLQISQRRKEHYFKNWLNFDYFYPPKAPNGHES